MLEPAISYLRIRSLGIPAMLLYLAMQGVFRGFKDTTTPLYAIGIIYTSMINFHAQLLTPNFLQNSCRRPSQCDFRSHTYLCLPYGS